MIASRLCIILFLGIFRRLILVRSCRFTCAIRYISAWRLVRFLRVIAANA